MNPSLLLYCLLAAPVIVAQPTGARPFLSGTATPGSAVTITSGPASTGSPVVVAADLITGYWSTSATAFANGPQTVTVTAGGPGGVSIPTTMRFTVRAPLALSANLTEQTMVQNGALSGSAHALLKPGGGTWPYTFSVFNPTTGPSTAASTATTLHGTVHIDPATGLFDYTPTQRYSGTDALGIQVCEAGVSGATCVSTLVPISIGPLLMAVSYPLAGAQVPLTTLIRGTATVGSVVTVLGPGNTTLCTTTALSGAFACPVTLAAGRQTLSVSANDGSNPTTITFTAIAPPTVYVTPLTAMPTPPISNTVTPVANQPVSRSGTASVQRPVAGTVSGTVRDSLTGRPLAGVAVVVDFRRQLTGTTADADGHYSIRLNLGEHIVVMRLVGYKPVRKVVNVGSEGVIVDVSMESVASQLEEVVVTTQGVDEYVRKPLLGVNQLNIATLKKIPAALGEVDLLRGLQLLPGVTSVGEASNGVNIRGGTTDQNLILLDDTPIFNPTHMFGLFSVFPPDVLGTVDLYKGNVPARFGGRAAAVLDVSLRNPVLDKAQLSGGVSFVSDRLTADIPIIKGKLGILIAARGAFNDFLLPRISNELADIRAKFGDGVVKAFWRINDRNTLTATGYYSKDLFQTGLLANLPNVNGTATRYDHQTLNLMARWFRTISPRADLQTTALYVHYVPTILSPELNSTNVVQLRSSVLQRQLKSALNIALPDQKLEIGLSGIHYQIEPGTLLPGNSTRVNYTTTPTENALELALHADYERNFGSKLAVSAGLRYAQFLAMGPSLVRHYLPGEPRDDVSVIDSTRYGAGQVSKAYGGFEPRLGIRYTLGPNSSLKLGYNLMRQFLQVVTNTTTPLPTSRWKTSDANIQPQVSQLVTAGYFLSFHNNVYELTVEGYWRSTQHIIDYRPGADFLLQPYPETQLLQGQSRAYGLETMISKKKGELTGWINYTYARTLNQVYEGASVEQNVNGGTWYRANYDRPHTLNASMTIDVDKHNSFGFTFAYSTGRPYTAPTGFVTIDNLQYPYYGERNQARLPDYHRLDFVWNIYNPSMKHRRWEGRWAFTIYNLYGRKNAYSVFFKTENGKTNAYQLQIFAAPIASLGYNFVFK